MVAWADTTLCTVKGGMGIENLYLTILTLKMRWSALSLANEDSTWVLLAHARISKSLDSSFHGHTRHRWLAAGALLFDEKMYISGSPLLRDLFKGFNLSRK